MSATLTPLPLTVSALLPLSIAAHAVGDYTRGWRRVVGLGVVLLGVAGIVVASPPGSTDAGGVVPTLIWIGLAFGAGMVAAQHSTRAAALQTLLTSIEAGRGHEVRLAVAEQRQHVARDLHDSVAHAMTVVCLHAAAARTHRDDLELTRASLATIEETVRGGMDELRQGLDALDLVEGSTPEASPGEHRRWRSHRWGPRSRGRADRVDHRRDGRGGRGGGTGGARRRSRVRGEKGHPRGAGQRRPPRASGARPSSDRRRAGPPGRRDQQPGSARSWSGPRLRPRIGHRPARARRARPGPRWPARARVTDRRRVPGDGVPPRPRPDVPA